MTLTRADAQANRARLIEAARAAFAENGPAAEMKDIAERANVGIGTIYRNFATKDELIAGIMETCILEAREDISRVLQIPDFSDRAAALAETAWRNADRNGVLFSAIGAFHGPEGPAPPPEILSLITRFFAEGAASGHVRRDVPPEVLARFMASLFTAYLDLRRTLDHPTVATYLTRLFLSAVGTTAPVEQT